MEHFDFKKSRIFWMILTIITFNWALNHLEVIWRAFQFLSKISMPVLIGVAFAFIISVFVDLIEEKVLKYQVGKDRYNRIRRPLSVTISVVIVIGFIVIVSVIIIPQIIQALQSLGNQIPSMAERIQRFLDRLAGRYPQFGEWINLEQINTKTITDYFTSFFTNKLPTALGSLVSVTSSVFNVVVNLFLGLILAIYFLLQRERILKGLTQIVYAFTNKEFTRRTTKLFNLTALSIKNFVTGQMIEAINVGLLTYLAMIVFSVPSALLVSFLVGITAMIPLFGAFIGVGLGFIIVAINNLNKALLFLVLVIIVIQLDNYFLYPRVVGNKTGTPPVIILLAVTIFGNLFGLVGMIIGVPLSAIIWTLLMESTRSRIQSKLETVEVETQPVRTVRKE